MKTSMTQPLRTRRDYGSREATSDEEYDSWWEEERRQERAEWEADRKDTLHKLKKDHVIEVRFADVSGHREPSIARQYKVVAIHGTDIEVIDLGTGKRQTIDALDNEVESIDDWGPEKPSRSKSRSKKKATGAETMLTVQDYANALKTASVSHMVSDLLLKLLRSDEKRSAGRKLMHYAYGVRASNFNPRTVRAAFDAGLVDGGGPDAMAVDGIPINVRLTARGALVAIEEREARQSEVEGQNMVLATDEFAEAMKDGKFEKGKPADPTENMSPEDAAEWERQNEENKDKFKSASGRQLSWRDGDRTAPWTPWGPAQYGTEIMRGVRVYGTAGHGGMAVAQGVARKLLTPAALKMGEFANGYYWYEEDAAIEIPLYERPEWFHKLQNREMSDQERTRAEAIIRRYSPRYFTMLEQGVQLAPKLTPGMTLSILKPISFGKGKFTMNVGDTVRVTEVRSGNMVVDFGGNLFRIPIRYYLDDDAYVAPSAKTASASGLSVHDYRVALELEAKFEKGKSMTVDEVAEVVGPEFKEMNENPPESVKKLKEEMSGKTAASGLYGFTKEAEKVCGAAANRLKKFASKIAKEIYEKDAESPNFLEVHAARSGSKAAKMLRHAMSDIGPGAPTKVAGKSGKGRYGFPAKTAKLALEACTAVENEAGVIASDLHDRMSAKYATITGFLAKHAKRAKCGWSDLILDAYPTPEEQVLATEDKSEKKASLEGYAIHPSVEEILAWDAPTRSAASFLASEEEEDAEVVVDEKSED